MRSLFVPAEAVISRINFAGKILVMVGFFLIPIVYLSALQLQQGYAKIESLKAEREGLEFVNGIRAVYEKVPQHRGLSQAVLKGDSGAKSKLDQAAGEVEPVERRAQPAADIVHHPLPQGVGGEGNRRVTYMLLKLSTMALPSLPA